MPLDDRTSLREAINNFSAVVLTGGSSGIGKSFIKLMRNVRRDLSICNLSHRSPDMFSEELNLRHAPRDFSRRGGVHAGVKGVLSILNREVPEGRVLLINTSGYGSHGRLLEVDLGKEFGIFEAKVLAVAAAVARLLTTMAVHGCALLKRTSRSAVQPGLVLATYGVSQTFSLNPNFGLGEQSQAVERREHNVRPGTNAIEWGVHAGLSVFGARGGLGQTPEAVVKISLRSLASPRARVVRGWRADLVEPFASCLPKRGLPARATKNIEGAELQGVER